MSDAPVTVVIPLFNKAREISRALDSVCSQSSAPDTILVVDDGSTDEGPAIVQAYDDPRIRLIRQSNAGPGPARNRGITEAETALVALIDADDEWLPGFLETVLQLRSRFPQAGLWAANYRMVPEESGAGAECLSPRFGGLSSPLPQAPLLIDDFFRCLDGDCPVCASNVLGRRSVFLELGGFSGETRIGEDWDMWFRIALKYPIAFTPSVQAVYRLDASNRAMHLGQKSPGVGTLLGTMTFENSIRQSLAGSELQPPYRASVERLLARQLVLHAKAAIVMGRGSAARGLLTEARALNRVREHWVRLWVQSFLGVSVNRILNLGRRVEVSLRRTVRRGRR